MYFAPHQRTRDHPPRLTPAQWLALGLLNLTHIFLGRQRKDRRQAELAGNVPRKRWRKLGRQRGRTIDGCGEQFEKTCCGLSRAMVERAAGVLGTIAGLYADVLRVV